MTYFPDLTPYMYDRMNHGFALPVLNVGWLDVSEPYSTGETSSEFQERLLDFCAREYIVLLTMGHRECQYCANPSYRVVVQHSNGKPITLGNGEIRVIGKSAIYAAPTLIFHYVTVHNYQPPNEFIEAVLNGPRPGSGEHKAILAKLHP